MREFDNDVELATWNGIQAGTLRSRYRGRAFLKSPFDQALYVQLIERLHPKTVIEIGVYDGGSALWFADLLRGHGIEPTIVGVDIVHVPDVGDDAVRFLHGSALDLALCLTPALLDELPRPWLVVEDSAHFYETSLAVLEFFAPRMNAGEYLVVEDGIVGSWGGPIYGTYNDGPNRAVREFLQRADPPFAVDEDLCDFYGRNVTYNPSGWLVRQ